MRLFARRRKPNTLLPMPVRYHTIVTWEIGHVRAAVLDLNDGSAQIFGVATAPINGISRTAHPDVDRWYAGINKALSQAEDMTPNIAGRRVVSDYVTMSVPSEIISQVPVRIAQDRRRASERITMDEINNLLQRGFRSGQDTLGAKGMDPSQDYVHGVVSRIQVDGERVTDPIGLHGSTLSLDLCFSVAPMEWVRALEVISQRLEVKLVNIVPHHVGYGSAVGDADALLVVIEPRHTTASIVHQGRSGCTVVVDKGQEDITERIASTMRLQGRQADALMRAYRGGQLREDIEYSLARVFWQELRGWMDSIASALCQVVRDEPMPTRIIVADLSRRLPEAPHALETPYWESCLAFPSLPVTTSLAIGGIAGVLDCTAQAGGSGYLLLRSLAHHVAHLYSPLGEIDRRLMEMVCWRSPSSATAKQNI